ncbi:hypothetical protein ACFFR3_35990 [Nonomuraea salmonea]|uniref:Transposase DDE domain-containing protein n=1 Tax=Nonomuraea salmonea TaxID=46181 RepID=A0ABV5NX78_9ACTN
MTASSSNNSACRSAGADRTAFSNVGTSPRSSSVPIVRRKYFKSLVRELANFLVADLDGLVRLVKRKLKKIQYRPHLLTGCLTQTGLTLDVAAKP